MSTTFAGAFDQIRAADEVREAVQHVPELRVHDNEAETLAAVRAHLQRWNVEPAALARVLDVRPSVVALLLDDANRIPAGPRHTLLRDARVWCEQDRWQRELRRARFVPTAVTRLVLGLARVVRETRTVGLLIGSPGLGKSHALEAVRGKLPGETVVVRADTDSRSAKGILRAIGEAAGSTAASAKPSVKAGIQAVRGGNGLLVIDEAHVLATFALEAARAVFDQANVGLLLAGSRGLRRVLSPQSDPLVGPLVARVALVCDVDIELLAPGPGGRSRCWIDAPTLRAILERHGVERLDGEASRKLLEVANWSPGHLRTALNAAVVAKCLGRSAGDGGARVVICGDDVRAALSMSGVGAAGVPG